MPPEIPVSASVVSTIIKINRQAVSNLYPLRSVEVFNKLDEITWASICFLGGMNASGLFSISDGDTFLPGNLIEVLTGYG